MTSPQIRTALEAATLAPSPHDTQPWRFEVADGAVDLFLDESRILAVADPDGREARMSCGAALFNLRMSLRSLGMPVRVKLMPDPGRPTLLARVRISGHLAVTSDEVLLSRAIARRRTNRRPFLEDPVPGSVQKALRQAALYERGRLVLLDQPERYSAVAALLRLVEFTPRDYGQEPLLGVLVTHGDTPSEHLLAGQAMQRVLLVATACEVSASLLSAAVELPSSRASLRSLLGESGYPQVVLCFGYGYQAPGGRRRPVSAAGIPVSGRCRAGGRGHRDGRRGR